jgi:hypothetical protein
MPQPNQSGPTHFKLLVTYATGFSIADELAAVSF